MSSVARISKDAAAHHPVHPKQVKEEIKYEAASIADLDLIKKCIVQTPFDGDESFLLSLKSVISTNTMNQGGVSFPASCYLARMYCEFDDKSSFKVVLGAIVVRLVNVMEARAMGLLETDPYAGIKADHDFVEVLAIGVRPQKRCQWKDGVKIQESGIGHELLFEGISSLKAHKTIQFVLARCPVSSASGQLFFEAENYKKFGSAPSFRWNSRDFAETLRTAAAGGGAAASPALKDASKANSAVTPASPINSASSSSSSSSSSPSAASAANPILTAAAAAAASPSSGLSKSAQKKAKATAAAGGKAEGGEGEAASISPSSPSSSSASASSSSSSSPPASPSPAGPPSGKSIVWIYALRDHELLEFNPPDGVEEGEVDLSDPDLPKKRRRPIPKWLQTMLFNFFMPIGLVLTVFVISYLLVAFGPLAGLADNAFAPGGGKGTGGGVQSEEGHQFDSPDEYLEL